MKRRIEMHIHGRVQGVSFRAYVEYRARSLGLRGSVQNSPDGSVYCVAQGEEDLLKKFLTLCAKGSPGARVERVEHHYSDTLEHFSDFRIL